MYISISQALQLSLFGTPMFGVDTCGFNGNSDQELCSRWMALSAFFPFYRNYNTLTAIPREAYVWKSVIESSKNAMAIRYSLLPYMYTLFYHAHTTGATVMRALQWEYPHDPALAGADRQFFLGPAILVTPVLDQGATSVDGVFPGAGGKAAEVYYDWYNQSAITVPHPGANITIDAPLTHIPVYIRGGYVLPLQAPALTTRDARNNPYSLLVALNLHASATGNLYIDDGESLVQKATLYVQFTATNNSLYAIGRGTYDDRNPLANVTVLGVRDEVSNVTFNGVGVPASGVS